MFLSQHFLVSTNFDKNIYLKKSEFVFLIEMPIYKFIFYFFKLKNTFTLYHYILYYMLHLSTIPNRSQLLEQYSSFRDFLFSLQSVKASNPLSDDV